MKGNKSKLFGKLIVESTILIVISAVVGLFFNHFSPRGIPLVYSEEPNVTLEVAYAYFQQNNVVFIDARHEYDFAEGHIKGAINIPFEQFEKTPEVYMDSLMIEYGKIWIIYCDGFECNSSQKLAAELSQLYYKDSSDENIKIFFGGWEQWKQANYPTDTLFN